MVASFIFRKNQNIFNHSVVFDTWCWILRLCWNSSLLAIFCVQFPLVRSEELTHWEMLWAFPKASLYKLSLFSSIRLNSNKWSELKQTKIFICWCQVAIVNNLQRLDPVVRFFFFFNTLIMVLTIFFQKWLLPGKEDAATACPPLSASGDAERTDWGRPKGPLLDQHVNGIC